MQSKPHFPSNKKSELYISDTEQDIIEKPVKFYSKEDIPKKRDSKEDYLFKKRSLRKVLSLEELDFTNKIWIGYYLDICLKKRKKYVLLNKKSIIFENLRFRPIHK